VKLLLLFIAVAVILGCRGALSAQRGENREALRWPLLVAAIVVAAGYLTQQLLR
jgi:hypothetical protein